MRRALGAVAVAAALLAGGCGDDDTGTKGFGNRCAADGECESGLCVGGVDGKEPVCTRSCRNKNDCPDGWSCSGVTQDDVLVCQHGPATPFGAGR